MGYRNFQEISKDQSGILIKKKNRKGEGKSLPSAGMFKSERKERGKGFA